MAFKDLAFNKINVLRGELEDAIDAYLRTSGWKATCDTPGSYWMWEKTVTGRESYPGDTRHNRTWLVGRDEACRLQEWWDREDYAKAHPEEFDD